MCFIILMSYACCKRDLYLLQKRPTSVAKETYIINAHAQGLFVGTTTDANVLLQKLQAAPGVKRLIYTQKEAYL